MNLKSLIREIPDFPAKGISFKDITTLLKDNDALHEVIKLFKGSFIDKGISKVIGIESRGFIIGGLCSSKEKRKIARYDNFRNIRIRVWSGHY